MIDMIHAAYVQVAHVCWRALPLLFTVFLMMALCVPVYLVEGQVPLPNIALASLFFWAMNGPSFMPPWAVFLVGLVQDLLSGTPLGFWVVLYLLAHGFTLTQRVFFRGRTGIGAWLGFALVTMLVAIAAWLMGMAIYERWLDPSPLALQALVTLVSYPLFARVFMLLRRMLTTAPESL